MRSRKQDMPDDDAHDEETDLFVRYKNSMIYELPPEELERFANAEQLAEDIQKSIRELIREVLTRSRPPSGTAVDLEKEVARGETSPVEETPEQKAATRLMSQEEYSKYIKLTRRLANAFWAQHEFMRISEERKADEERGT
jgi:hypothetical protein